MDGWELLIGWILGVVEGLTEFAPISSTGHMILVDDLLFNSPQYLGAEVANTFKVVIQLGSILAVIIIFWRRLLRLLGLQSNEASSSQQLSWWHILVGLIPATVAGILFEDWIDQYLFSTMTVIVGLVLGAILMIVAEKKQTPVTSEHLDALTYKQAFGIGLFQCFALWPGFSRSGSTIAGGILLGANHRTASEFSFLMAIPIMFGASLLKLVKSWQYLHMNLLPLFLVGFFTAFIVALITIRFFLRLINTIKLTPFALYRLVLASIILVIVWL